MADAPTPRVRASVVCRQGDRVLTVRAVDPVTTRAYLFLPGGAVDPGETAAAAAVREAREESGYAVRIVGEPVVAHYAFDWGGRPWACHTSFFRADLIDPAAEPMPDHDETYLHGVDWVEVADVHRVFDYHPVVRAAVVELLGRPTEITANGGS